MGANYQRELEKIIDGLGKGERPALMLHSCCAPCSSHCMAYLRDHFDVTVFYYNPNITREEEYRKRVEEEKRLIREYNAQVDAFRDRQDPHPGDVMMFPGDLPVSEKTGKIDVIEGDYDRDSFWELAKGLEECPEGGERCFRCYELRLRATAREALRQGSDYFTTTLTISPLKNAEKLNEIGNRVGEELGVSFLPSDFKKKNGYRHSVELSACYGLYRQDYCGCIYSEREAMLRREKNCGADHPKS